MGDKIVEVAVKNTETSSKRGRKYKPRVNSKRYKQGYQQGIEDASRSSWWEGYLWGSGTVVVLHVFWVFFC